MVAQLYCDWQVTEVVESESSPFGHRFGGPIEHDGVSEGECGFPCQMLYHLSADDPYLRIRIPGVKWLPLYYSFCFENRTMRTSYRVVSESRVVTYFDQPPSAVPAGDRFPWGDSPREFPEAPVALQPIPFDATNRKDVRQYAGVFGIGRLSAADKQELLEEFRSEWDSWSPDPWSGPMEGLLEAMGGPCPQGPPRSACPNPECENHERRNTLELFAIVPSHPVSHCSLWGEWAEFTVIIYEMCSRCSTITATNQCT